MLITGGAVALIGFSMLGFYGVQFVNNITEDKKVRLEPGGSVQVQQNISASQGSFAVIFPNPEGQLKILIKDPSGHVVIERTVEPPLVLQSFDVIQPGNYTLVISNPTDHVLEPSIVLGNQESVLSQAIGAPPATLIAIVIILFTGAAVAVAGTVITILDKRRTTKMKQFGDTSDLV